MDVREKYVMQKVNRKEKSICPNCIHHNLCIAENNQPCFECNRFIDANGVTMQEWYSASNPPKEDGTYLVQTNTGTITTARFYAFKSFPATKYLPACHRSPSWQSNRNVVKWTFLPQPPKGE